MTTFTHIDDAQLLRHAHLAVNELTTPAIQVELMRRFEDQITENALNTGAVEVLAEFGIEPHTTAGIEQIRAALQFQQDYGTDLAPVGKLLDVLRDQDVDDPETLRKRLDRLAKFDQAMQDLTEPLSALQSLTTTE